MEQIRKLPIGIQTFEKLREENYLYVDKTAMVYQMASASTPYFLSRPRRFGKSLLLSTFEAYFQGRKDLFRGLAIERLESDWETYPVFHLDLNAEKYDCKEALEQILSRNLSLWEDRWGRDAAEHTLSSRFSGCIRRAAMQSGKQVVVLVDEYDKPLLQALLDESLSDEYRRILKAFYGVLKSADRYLRFVFLTGVTKFAQVSVFSDLNQLNDISMKQPYAGICGITQGELLQVFRPELEALALRMDCSLEMVVGKMRTLYDGYHFHSASTGLFNPFSVLNAFDANEMGNYWFQTGTPTYLVDLLKQSDYDLRLLIDGVEVTSSSFSEYRAEAGNPLPMIYQSGYLTIKGYDKEVNLYTLGFPNDEVRYGFLNFLLPYYTQVSSDETGFRIAQFMRKLRAGDVDAFMEHLRVFFSGIPYELSDNTERHYQAIFYVVFTLLGQFVETEVRSARGRADAVVKTKDAVYVFEFKLNGTAEEALRQITEKGYLIPYRLDGKRLVKVGVNFSKETRNVERYLVEG
ncbi:ATP-binding protein [Bacteroides muris (ex Fokt et al. 2023)]|uniref:ATP-binding protein n=1 Tax=Bacteroides muris (ex Fokt et al. 2023) TaxID=2937417 RepID=A0A9X2NU16_9BACE|nr:ATP-binding protein [Bacteroides muris (ex Fokt et al. 2023)]MCR6505858.1 ATP-binding protein [Bacteroides muris (ex Fokt et al. 2023)]